MTDSIETLLTNAGGVGALLILLHLRLNRMEARLDQLCDAHGLEKPKRRRRWRAAAALVIVVVMFAPMARRFATPSDSLHVPSSPGLDSSR